MRLVRLIATALVPLVVVPVLPAQQDGDFVQVDRVAAIVGNTVIPLSRVEEELNVMRAQGADVPTDSAGVATLRQRILESLINDELLVQAARRDTAIVVTEQEVQAAADQAIREVRDQFPSELAYRRQLRQSGFATVDEYRSWLADQQRRKLLIDQLIEKLRQSGVLAPLPPTERELRQAFEETRPRQPKRPASVSFRQILIPVRADSAAQAKAFAKADSVRRLIQEGGEFATLARRFSDDPTTAERGGELGWIRRGVLVKEFEDVAFRIRPGVVSRPVQTTFGFHLIEVQRATPAEVQVRHILIRPELTEADKLEARTVAEAVARALREGASFDSLARLHRDPDEEVLLENVPRDELPAGYQTALADAQRGDIVGPVELQDQAGRVKYAVIRFEESRPAGEYSFEDVRDRLRGQLAEQNAVERYLRQLRERTYVDIRI